MFPLFAFVSAWACPIGATSGKHPPLLGVFVSYANQRRGLAQVVPKQDNLGWPRQNLIGAQSGIVDCAAPTFP